MTNDPRITIGSRVSYRDINLRNYRGIVVALGRTPGGGDCHVEWDTPHAVSSAECLCNLRLLDPSHTTTRTSV